MVCTPAQPMEIGTDASLTGIFYSTLNTSLYQVVALNAYNLPRLIKVLQKSIVLNVSFGEANGNDLAN